MPAAHPPIESHEELVAALRSLPALRDKGKVHPAFYYRSRAFLHFHGGPEGLYADVRFGDQWERAPVVTPAQRARLLTAVQSHVTRR